MVIGYWSVAILFWQLSIDHFDNVLCKRWGLATTRLRHPSLPFDSLPLRTLGQSRDNQTKRGWPYSMIWVWGSVPRALRAGGSPAITRNTTFVKISWPEFHSRGCLKFIQRFPWIEFYPFLYQLIQITWLLTILIDFDFYHNLLS